MRKITAFFLFFLISPAYLSAKTSEISILNYVMDAFNDQNPAEALRQFAPDARIRLVDQPGLDPTDKKSFLTFLEERNAELSESAATLINVMDFDEVLVGEYLWTGTLRREEEQKFAVTGLLYLRFQNGKIQDWIDVYSPKLLQEPRTQEMAPLSNWDHTIQYSKGDSDPSGYGEKIKIFYEALNSAQYESVEEMCALDVMLIRHYRGTQRAGRDALIESYKGLRTTWPHFKMTIRKVHVAEESVFVYATFFTGEQSKDFFEIYHFRDGRIYQIDRYLNNSPSA